MSNALVYEPNNIGEALTLSEKLVSSRLLPRGIDTPEKAFTIVCAGKELGLTAMQSLRSIHLIDGKITMSADAMVALAMRHPDCLYFRMIESNDRVATYETQRRGDPEPTRLSFTIEEAKAAGLAGKDTWKKYPAAMLRARVRMALVREKFPDIGMGVYDPEELEPAPRAVQAPPAPVSKPRIQEAEIVVDAEENDAAEPPVDLVDQLEERIRSADGDQLNDIGKQLLTLKGEGRLTVLEWKRLAAAGKARKQELEAAQ